MGMGWCGSVFLFVLNRIVEEWGDSGSIVIMSKAGRWRVGISEQSICSQLVARWGSVSQI
jgi:hypothetical protein